MKEHIWPEDERAQLDDVFEETVDPDRGRAIEDRYGCVRYGDETGTLRLATHYFLPAVGLESDELLRRLDPLEYEALDRRRDRRRGDERSPWLVLVEELDDDDQAALLRGFGLTVEQARVRLGTSSPAAEHRGGAIRARWHCAASITPRSRRHA